MALALQICGALIVAAALTQACIGLVSQVSAAVRSRRLDRERMALFRTQTANLVGQAKVERERTELTWPGKRKFRIVKRRVENEIGNICSFYLEPHDGGKLPSFKPGQFLTFELAVTSHPAPVIRCYSLSDSPFNTGHYRVSIKRLPPPPAVTYRAPGGLSSCFFHDNLREGDVVDVMAPNGSFVLDVHSDRPVVLIAGGIGLTPVLSMLKWLADSNSHREVWFFYGVPNSKEMALKGEIDAIVSDRQHFHSVIAFSQPSESCVEGKDYDCHGFLSVDLIKQHLKTSNYEFYMCGPPPMMEAVATQLSDWGVPEKDIHTEAFGPASVKRVGKPELPGDVAEDGVKVEFSRSGKSFVWTPESGTLLELAEANGIRINFGCRAGNCNTCLTAIKNGKVAYINPPATPLAQGSALVCIAQPDGEISLDA